MGFSRFISDDEEDEYRRGLGEEDPANRDWAWLVQAARDPSGAAIQSAPTDPRQARRPDGLGAALDMKEAQGEKSQMPTLASGDISGDSNTAKRIFLAQGMDQDPATPNNPERNAGSDKMFSDSRNATPEKPPGPDSPSANYKEPSRYDKAKEAYDKEFGPGKKHKWYSLESTDAWEARRAAGQHSLMLEQRQEESDRREAATSGPRVYGQAMRMLGTEGDGIYQGYTDGTFKKVGGVLDKDADTRYGEQVSYDGQGRAYVKEKGSYKIRFLEDPDMGKPLADTVSGGPTLHGPTDPYVDRWVPPQKNAELSYGEKLVDPTGKLLAQGGDRPVAPRGSGGAGTSTPQSPEAKLEAEAAAYAEKTVDARLKTDKRYNAMKSDSAKLAYETGQKKLVKQEYIRRHTGGDASAAPPRVSVDKPAGPSAGAR